MAGLWIVGLFSDRVIAVIVESILVVNCFFVCSFSLRVRKERTSLFEQNLIESTNIQSN